MHSLEADRKKILELWNQGKFDEAEAFYWKDVFPKAEKKFLEENKVDKEYDWLIMPGGFVPEYHIFLIKALKPKNVYFIGTHEFKERCLDEVIRKAEIPASRYIVDVVEYKGMNLTDVYDRIRNRLNLFVNKKVVLDLTRGKRIMSVGAGIVGAFFGFDLVYLDKEWDSYIKRGIPGTEKLITVKNPFEVFGDLELREARDFFAHYNYGAALSLYKRIRQKVVDPRRVEIEELLAEAYLHWNSFNFKAAYNKFQQVILKSQQYEIEISPELIENLHALKILHAVNVNEYKELDDESNIHLIIDLYVNAMRKAETGMFEDAVSRLYRVIELISQFRLNKYNISTLNPNLSKFEEEYKKMIKQIYGIDKPLPYEIGLKDGYILLFILKDSIFQGESIEDLKQMFGVIRTRDMSIIAHGLNLTGDKSFSNLKDIAKKFIQRVCQNLNKDSSYLIKQHTFVKLS